MRLQERDLTDRSPSPALVVAYLRATGWRKGDDLVRRGSRTATQFVQDATGTAIWIPVMPEADDYTRLLADAINAVAESESRSPELVVADMWLSRADLLRVRRRDRHDHAVPLRHAPALFTGARDLVTAAAMAADEPRSAFPGRRRSDVVRFLDTVMLGQTEPASFGVRILLPLPPPTSAPIEQDVVPFPRRVSEMLVVAVDRARKAAAAALIDGTLEHFRQEVSFGVSAELCRAIALLGGDDGSARVEVGMTYDRAIERPASLPVLFEGDVFAALRDAATFLADQEPRLGVEIEGVVVALDTAVPAGHDRREGNLTIGAIVDGNVRRIRVGLPEPIYSRAVEAHRDERRVAVTGNLIREGRHYRLVEPRSFVLLD